MTNSILTDFETEARVFFVSVEGGFKKFVTAFLPKIENLVEVAFEDLASIAGKAVLAQALKVASGQEKFGNAVQDVVQTVESSGKTVGIQTAQAAVQIAFLTAQSVASGK